MPRRKLSRYSNFGNFLVERIQEELSSWSGLIRDNLIWVLFLVLMLAAFIHYSAPFPPSEVRVAVGQPGGAIEMLGKKFKEKFTHYGVNLELVYSQGSSQSLQELADPAFPINAAFLMAGTISKDEYPNLASLGSIQSAPLWLFYRGPEFTGDDVAAYFSDKRISVGVLGSGTQHLVRELLKLRGIQLEDKPNILQMPHRDATEALIAGKIDALCLVDSFDSPLVQKLLNSPGLRLYNFKMIPAFAKKLPFLNEVVIPRGSLDLIHLVPVADIHMPATTTVLVVEKDLHPAIQQMFLMAAKEIDVERNHFFAPPHYYPRYTDVSVPESEVSARFWEKGAPPLERFMPIWLASYIDRMWLMALTLFAIAIPAIRISPSYRRFQSGQLITGAYEELRLIERHIARASEVAVLFQLKEQLVELEEEISSFRIASDNLDALYGLKKAIDLIGHRIADRIKQIQNPD